MADRVPLEVLFDRLAENIRRPERVSLRRRLLARLVDPEVLDPTPHELAGRDRPETLRETVQRYIRSELSRQAVAAGAGTFEDEDDFSEDDPEADLLSRHDVRLLVPENKEGLDGSEDAAPSPPSPEAKA